MASFGVDLTRVSRIVGYLLKKGDFRVKSPNLPQRIAMFGEANEANQAGLDLTPIEIRSAKHAGELFGFGSPLYLMARILKPVSGDGIGGIPLVAYPQAKAVGATQKTIKLIPTGVATGNGTHTVLIGGRGSLDGVSYDINIETGDTAADITQKIADAVNAVVGSPVTAIDFDYETHLKTKWAGLTANELSVSVDTNDNALGITYTVQNYIAGSGTPSVADALESFGNVWNTFVLNGYGLVSSVLTALEQYNGIADPENPTGRYTGIIFKPFRAISGSISDDPSAITHARLNEMTVAVAPAPGSAGFSFEAAANVVLLAAPMAQNEPHRDISGLSYIDMPTPVSIGSMAVYANRDYMVKRGCSTVDLVAGKYQIQEIVTTYHPVGEEPPAFRYVRDLVVDDNIRYSYYLAEQIHVVDKVIVSDSDLVEATNTITPKQWAARVNSLSDEWVARALTTDSDFTKQSIDVDLSDSNPNRFETYFRCKRTSVARVSSTVAEVGFNFGS
jgi:phage tail sheath gpL-like